MMPWENICSTAPSIAVSFIAERPSMTMPMWLTLE